MLLRRLGSRQIRNRGTIGGNIGNASPIGDTPPVLIALDATPGAAPRRANDAALTLEDFFLGYRRTALAPGEFIERIDVPMPRPGGNSAATRWPNASTRTSPPSAPRSACDVDGGVVRDIRIGFGGMAATPARARADRTGADRPALDRSARSRAAMDVLDADSRRSPTCAPRAAYRRMVARNLLLQVLSGDRCRDGAAHAAGSAGMNAIDRPSAVGDVIAHDSAAKHVSGEALYIDDMPEPPGLLHAFIRLSARTRMRGSSGWTCRRWLACRASPLS